MDPPIVILTYYAIIIVLVLFRINILDQLVAHVAITKYLFFIAKVNPSRKLVVNSGGEPKPKTAK